MSTIRILAKGYYSLEPTGTSVSAAVSSAVLDAMDEAWEENLVIPDDEIHVVDYAYPELEETAK